MKKLLAISKNFMLLPGLGGVLLLCGTFNTVFAQKISEQLLPNTLSEFIQQEANSLVHNNKLPGMFIGVFDQDRVGFFGAGYADTASKRQFDKNTSFEIGSITKTLTAFVLLKVLKEHKINDRTPIYSFLPDSVQKNEALKYITFLSLMNHTSGLPKLPDNLNSTVTNKFQPYENYTTDKLYSCLLHSKPLLDNKVNYSNLGAALAGVLAERLSNLNYNDLLKKYLFKSLHINQKDSSMSYNATGYFNGEQVPFWKFNAMAPAGAVKLNASDMITYLRFMSEKNSKEQITIDSLTSPTVQINMQRGFARGWLYNQENGGTIYWHNGGTLGFSTFAAFSKGQSKGIMIVINAFNKKEICDPLGILIMQKLLNGTKP